MRRTTHTVEIKEPPMQEFKKRGSCFKRTCVVGCGSIVLFILIVIAGAIAAGKPRTKELRNLPDHFPKSVTLYDANSIDRITILSERDRGRWPGTFMNLLRRPIPGQRDTVEIHWTDLPAQPNFIQKYYETALRREGFNLMIAAEKNSIRQFTFTKDAIEGRIAITDNPEQSGTDTVDMKILIPTP